RMDGAQREAVAFDQRIVGQRDVRVEIGVAAGIHPHLLAGTQGPRRAMRAEAGGRRAGGRRQPGGERRVIAMGVADEDMADRPAADRRQQGGQVLLVVRAGIEDGQRLPADDVAVGAVKGEGAGIGRGDADHVRRHRDRLSVRRRKTRVEFKCHGCGNSSRSPRGGLTIAARHGTKYTKIHPRAPVRIESKGTDMASAITARPLISLALPQGRSARLLMQVALVVGGTLLLTLAAKTKVVVGPVDLYLGNLAVLALVAAFGLRL